MTESLANINKEVKAVGSDAAAQSAEAPVVSTRTHPGQVSSVRAQGSAFCRPAELQLVDACRCMMALLPA